MTMPDEKLEVAPSRARFYDGRSTLTLVGKEAHMATLSTVLMEKHEEMFRMIDTGLSSIPDKPLSNYTSAELTALRLVLHSLEAIDNYWSMKPPPNFGESLPLGVRSSDDETEFPAYVDIKAYLAETKERAEDYLSSQSDGDFLSKDNSWDWELLNMFFYVTNHTFTHLGHLDQVLYEDGDPRGWECWTHDFGKG